MSSKLETLQQDLQQQLGERIRASKLEVGELTVEVAAQDYLQICQQLRDSMQFEQLIDLCAVDYLNYANAPWNGRRYAVVLHLLSVARNVRLRVRVWCDDDELPLLPSVNGVWNAANWYEREAFDLYGVVFEGHDDLRRILTDYGFIGHPFRKDFPVSGTVEMRYDPETRRVVYQPVTIEPREIVPRVVREEGYGGLQH